MKIEILGTGCTKCKALEEAVKKAVAIIGGFHEVKKVEDIVEIMNYGVMSTPALVVDGEVKSVGKLLSVDEIVKILSK
ncbi:thioredoxin family protein [Aliarcobacter skirrowii]|jgi:small redox-active disulfide protein 2|uniref:thioredoxin family protein n=1 Tax=Aliarcobacter skirrowii TaxID=28200 RepID=UPI000825CE9A|nr:thioredoxin family protein [Aliarcobacter skirrowii]MDD2507690.1 thioredoxin family protein [Aliarcobacter skirrowii]MDD3496042.1 thioredoxin family protein [Aliarcobacter skirrowii]MDX4027048.1 thioredoxin family protein [Aliarcobacter skirrowii]MDY0180083.1 thioredoxin family protein [Aliarcobacter skirrowii]HAC70825.1 thioredoxin family protein [Aliarcobacter skirrowii]